ncbi:MAG TPA: 50S ribosomal protein L11 methyltransferase [Dehalococcoidia bacterium]|nr:50S ribosomal protein L11 methyltransferase [Dehalococcoidia bacterium]
MIADEWVEVALTVCLAEAERAQAVLDRFIVSGTSVEMPFEQGEEFGVASFSPEAEARVSGYVPARDWPGLEPSVAAALEAEAEAGDWRAGAPRLSSRVLLREDWETAWHAFVRIVRTGRLVIRPTSIDYVARPGEVVADLAPGLAFGTGQHETTRLALTQMERHLQTGAVVLDFGCGSGILACAAARLGASRVDAVDVDALAVMATEQNVALNGMTEVVHVRKGTTPPVGGSYDLVVANITAGILASHMEALCAVTRLSGICVLSGIIDSQVERVEAAIRETALNVLEIEADGEWRAIVTTRSASVP